MITRLQIVCLAILLLGDFAVGSLWAAHASAQVPVHWNFQGQADRMGSPWELAFILPASLVFTLGLLLSLLLIGSVRDSLKRSGPMYGRMLVATIAALVAVHAMLLTITDHPQAMLKGLPLPIGALFFVLGNWMGKIRRNSVMGIRTPWTLKSDYVWERTHRIGGRLMVAHGLAIMLSALLFPLWATVAILIVGIIGLVTWAMIFSAALSRQERRRDDAPPTAASAR